MLQGILNKYWKQHPTKLPLYGQLPPISQTIQIRQTRHVGHYWRSKYELISNILLWTPSHRHANVGWPIRTNLQQLCIDTVCRLQDLLEAINDRDGWLESPGNPWYPHHMMMMMMMIPTSLRKGKLNSNYL